MAILRRNGSQVSGSIWPGFVDAMTALLMILMFVLTIFMVVQFVLRETITGQDVELDNLTDQVAVKDAELDTLSAQIAGLAEALGLEQTRTKGLEGELTGVQGDLQSAQDQIVQQTALISSLSAETEGQKSRIVSFEEQVAGLLSQRDDLSGQLTTARTSLSDLEQLQTETLSEKEAVQLALAQARGEIDLQTEQARLAAAKREALQALIADLNRDAAVKNTQITAITSELAQKNTQIETIETKLAQEEKQRLAEVATVVALQERLEATRSELNNLQSDITAKDTALSEAEKLRLVELVAAKALRERLKNSQDELTAMTLALEAKRQDAEDTLTLLAAARAAKTAATDLAEQHLSDKEKEAALLAQANALLNDEQALSAESQRKVALLNQQTNALRGQLNALQGLLDDANAKDTQAQIQIENLGSNLNSALARVASEQKRIATLEAAERKRLEAETKDLKRFRSEFFGRLRDVLGDQEGIRIVGDRFVFSSEILYTAGSATLGERGKVEIGKVADIIQDVADQIPEGIDWILRVDGHTDNTALSGFGKYRDNWELSQARALAVVKYLIDDLGIPADRLAANGFGEFQPIAIGDSPEALALNRRIELKFTEK